MHEGRSREASEGQRGKQSRHVQVVRDLGWYRHCSVRIIKYEYLHKEVWRFRFAAGERELQVRKEKMRKRLWRQRVMHGYMRERSSK